MPDNSINKKVVILTGDEMRHEYFRKTVAMYPGIEVLASYCEGVEHSLENRIYRNTNSSAIERLHVDARTQAEKDFFGDALSVMDDRSHPTHLEKGDINSDPIIAEIESSKADLLICYGSSLIRSSLLSAFNGRFLNVHLGLSPYYRGSGTNVWPLINQEPHMVGATFMYIDEGIDTGEIIHQIRADVVLGDSPHSIGNRLIKAMTDSYSQIICSFDNLAKEEQPRSEGALYLRKDFDKEACERLYRNFYNEMISEHLSLRDSSRFPYIVTNSGISET